MQPRTTTVAAVVLVILGAMVGTGAIQAQEEPDEFAVGEPDLELVEPYNSVEAGTTDTIEFEFQNEGDLSVAGSGSERVLVARGVTATLDDDGPFEDISGEVSVGTIQDGASAAGSFEVEVPADVEPGTYDLTVDAEYAYTSRVTPEGTEQRETATESFDLTVTVPEEPRFELTDVSTTAEPGDSGEATLEVRNVGTQRANDTRISLAGGAGVTVDGGEADELLGDLSPGDATTITVDVALAEGVSDGEKPIEASFTYEDPSGLDRAAGSETIGLSPAAEQSFTVESVEGSLSVGFEGEITGVVVNDGPEPVEDGVLVLEPATDSVVVEDTRYALPSLDPGEEATFAYRADVSSEADPGPRQVQLRVEHDFEDGDPDVSDTFVERVAVDEEEAEFDLTGTPTVDAGEEAEITVTITNQRSQTLTNVDAQLYADDPLTVVDEEAFVDELEPGEEATLRFQVAADGTAMAKEYPVELDFQYDTQGGETRLSDTYQHPVTVSESTDDGGSSGSLVGILGLVGVVVAAVGLVLYRRQDDLELGRQD